MKHLAITAITLALIMLSCGPIEQEARIRGTVVGADGSVPPLAHVHLLKLGNNISATIMSVKVGDDGSFVLDLPDDGYYDMLVTAVNHRSVRIPLVSDDVIDLSDVRVKPAPYQYIDPMEEVRIIGDWNRFSRREAEPMTLQDDGTFVYERQVEGDTLTYQLLGVETSGRSINGTDSDYYIYDGGGDYLSIVSVKGNMARVTFDLNKARIHTSEDLPDVSFGDEGHPVAEVWQVQKQWLAEAHRRDLAFSDYMNKHTTYEGFEYDLSDIKNRLLAAMSGDTGPEARRYAAVKLASLWEMGLILEEDIFTAIERMLPVTDPMWGAEPIGFLEIFRQIEGPENMVRVFDDNLDKITDKRVKGAVLLEIGLGAKAAGDTGRQREIYDDLMDDYVEITHPYISYRIMNELNPNLRIAGGKSVPEFELSLLDNKQVVSRESMLGKYYLIDFWATWCGPCVGEMPNLHSAYDRFTGDNFEIISISFDQSVEDITEFRADKWKMPWLHAYMEGGFAADMAREFEVTGIPKPVLVDPEGTIVAAGPELRGERLEETLAQHLEK